MNNNTSTDILIFTIALNGYEYLYKKNFISHENYAKKYGYSYICVKKPGLTTLGIECAWLKVALMIRALRNGYRWVIFLDADTRVSEDTPAIITLEKHRKSLYVAKGYSGRLNSGVLIAKNCFQVLKYFEQTLSHAEMPLPAEDDVGWGENGHLIHFASQRYFVHYLDQRWNNNVDQALDDYIRHYSYGPLHGLYHPLFVDKLRYLIQHYTLAVLKRAETYWQRLFKIPKNSFSVRLNSLVEKTTENYPVFADIGSTHYQRYLNREQHLHDEQLSLQLIQQSRSTAYPHLRIVRS